MKYKVQAKQFARGQLWEVLRGNRVLATFEHKEDALDYAQSCVEDDAWHASNRD